MSNMIEKTLVHYETKIKSLEAKNAELESYKKDWQEIAGRANLKHLVARYEELEKRLDKATTMIVNHEAKLSFTLEALEKIRDDRSPPWDKTDFQCIARKALSKI